MRIYLIVFFAIVGIGIAPDVASAQAVFENVILRASDVEARDEFGEAVSISGNRAIVGAIREGESLGEDHGPGAAYVFEQNAGGSWVEVAKLSASNGEPEDQFGHAVAIEGDWALVGAPREDGESNNLTNSGAVYVFKLNSSGEWEEIDLLRSSNSGDRGQFGFSIALEGNRAVVGALREDSSPDRSPTRHGLAYIFERTSADTWTEEATLESSDMTANDNFGWSVDLDNNQAIVGARLKGVWEGAAYIFERNNAGDWKEAAKLVASNSDQDDEFGRSVAISGRLALVGAPFEAGVDNQFLIAGAAYVFKKDSEGRWTESDILRSPGVDILGTPGDGSADYFGYSIAMDGDLAIIGAPRVEIGGSRAYVLERDDDAWVQISLLAPSNEEVLDNESFGHFIDVDDRTVIIGAPAEDGPNGNLLRAGAVYIYGSAKLPVELAGFQAFSQDGVVELLWTTVSESNNTGFEVQRSVDGTGPWRPLTFVKGHGTTTTLQKYQFFDRELPFGYSRLSYRLKQLDFDGTTEYSDPIQIYIQPPTGVVLQPPFPNPASNHSVVRIETAREGRVVVELYDVMGRRVNLIEDSDLSAGQHAFTIPVSELSSGIYFLMLRTHTGVMSKKMVVNR